MAPNVTQYQFDLVDVAKLLLQKEGINEGLWTIGFNFAVGAIVGGPTPDSIRPTMMVSVDKVMLSRVEGPAPLTIDASTGEPVPFTVPQQHIAFVDTKKT